MLCELCKEFVMYIVDISSTCRKDKFKIKTDIKYKILNFYKSELQFQQIKRVQYIYSQAIITCDG